MAVGRTDSLVIGKFTISDVLAQMYGDLQLNRCALNAVNARA